MSGLTMSELGLEYVMTLHYSIHLRSCTTGWLPTGYLPATYQPAYLLLNT